MNDNITSSSLDTGTFGQRVFSGLSKLGFSLGITMVLALALKLYMPRVLGPERLGTLYFAESFSLIFFSLIPLGLPVYITKEVPANPDHAKEIFSTISFFGLVSSVLVGLILTTTMLVADYDFATVVTTLIMGAYIAFYTFQQAFARKMFLSLGYDSFVAKIDVTVKIILVSTAFSVLIFYPNLYVLAGCFALSEISGTLFSLRKAKGLGLLSGCVSLRLLRKMLVVSLPFFFSAMFLQIYANIDITMLAHLANKAEVGFYGAAIKLKGVFLLIVPIMFGVMQPLLSKALKENREQYILHARNILKYLIALSLPLSMLLIVFGDKISLLLYGPGFEPSYRIVAVLSLVLALTYLNVLFTMCVNLMTNGKKMAASVLVSAVINIILNYLFIPIGASYFGPGGAGVGSAIATVISEAVVCTYLWFLLGRGFFSKELVLKLAILFVPCFAALIIYDLITSFSLVTRIVVLVPAIVIYMFGTKLLSREDVKISFQLVRKTLVKS